MEGVKTGKSRGFVATGLANITRNAWLPSQSQDALHLYSVVGQIIFIQFIELVFQYFFFVIKHVVVLQTDQRQRTLCRRIPRLIQQYLFQMSIS